MHYVAIVRDSWYLVKNVFKIILPNIVKMLSNQNAAILSTTYMFSLLDAFYNRRRYSHLNKLCSAPRWYIPLLLWWLYSWSGPEEGTSFSQILDLNFRYWGDVLSFNNPSFEDFDSKCICPIRIYVEYVTFQPEKKGKRLSKSTRIGVTQFIFYIPPRKYFCRSLV